MAKRNKRIEVPLQVSSLDLAETEFTFIADFYAFTNM